jgi:hypothetical protein
MLVVGTRPASVKKMSKEKKIVQKKFCRKSWGVFILTPSGEQFRAKAFLTENSVKGPEFYSPRGRRKKFTWFPRRQR